MRISSPAVKKMKNGQSAFLVFADLQVPLTQNSQYASTAYFGVACSEPFQYIIYFDK